MPRTQAADDLHAMKYRARGEDFREAMNRIAFGLKDNDKHYHVLREILLDQRFLPGGRIQGTIGSMRFTTAFNCLSGDTEFLTDFGFVRLKDWVGKTVHVLSPITGQFEAAQVKKYGTQELCAIKISNSKFGQERAGTFTIYATANHRWLLQNGAVTETLTTGDILACSSSDLDLDLDGWVHGFIYGDGSKWRDEVEGKPKSNPAYTEEYPFKKYYVRLCGSKARHLQNFTSSSLKTRIVYHPSSAPDPSVMCLSKRELKQLPHQDETPEYKRGFVEGLIAADGSVGTRPGDAFMVFGKQETIEWMRDHLILANYAPAGRPHAHGSQEPTNYGERSYPIWVQSFRTCDDHKGFRVLSITPSHRAEVYCIEEPKGHQFTLRHGLATGNCFVAGTIADSYVDGSGSIMQRAHEAAATMRMGGGIGYDFSTLRPRGSLIKKLQSQSTGPINFMRIFNEVCLCTASSGHRRGAQMGVLRVDHPDIQEFVLAKQNTDQLTGFNISVAVTDEFMQAVIEDGPFDLKFNGTVHTTVSAAQLWERIMRSTWDWAEPGVLFIDRMNELNNLYYCETIAATNPCSEQPLPPFGACLLGSFNLVRYLSPGATANWAAQSGDLVDVKFGYTFNFDQLIADVAPVVRAMDNVTDRTRYPLAEQKAEALTKRRMGLGVTGLANAGEACGYVYGSPEFCEFEKKVLSIIRDESYRASVQLAQEKGAFPLFDAERYCKGTFIKTLPEDIQKGIRINGIRNSHLTSIAPTGTISMAADNVSSSIEPVFSYSINRAINTPDGVQNQTIGDYGAEFLNVRGKLAADVTAEEHVRVLTTAQSLVDSAVSKTVNMDGRTMPWEAFKDIYRRAWEAGAKGCSTFNVSGKRNALLEIAKVEGAESGACAIDATTGRMECS